MSDLIIQSNQSSVILRSLQDSEVQNLAYEIAPSMPILAKTYRELRPNGGGTGLAAGQEVVFNINKSMLLRDMQIKTTFTHTGANLTATGRIGLSLMEWIQIRSNNKVIMTMTDSYTLARTQQEPEAKQTAIYRRALPLTALTETPVALVVGDVGHTYTPVFCSFFEDTKSNLDLNFYEQLQCVLRFNTNALMAGVSTNIVTLVNVTLWVWTYKLDDKSYDLLRSQNQNPSAPLNMLTYNTFTERTVCTGTGTTTMRLNVNYPVFNTYVMIRNRNTGSHHRIESFTFSVGGTELLTAVPHLVGNWESESHGASKIMTSSELTVARYNNDCIALNWGLDPQNRLTNTGAISFNQINHPQITLVYGTLVAADHDVIVCHEYWNILTLDSSNGSVGITVNS